MRRTLYAVLVLAVAAGCSRKVATYTDGTPLPSVTQIRPVTPDSPRFDLVRVQSFDDDSAYGGFRSIYLLKDRQTGTEYVGISGIGISELGSHKSGKTTVRDER